MAPFVSLSECCLRGSVLPGTPRGEMQRAGPDGLRVDRYYARPAGVLKHPKACVVLLYDIFGFQLVRGLYHFLPSCRPLSISDDHVVASQDWEDTSGDLG